MTDLTNKDKDEPLRDQLDRLSDKAKDLKKVVANANEAVGYIEKSVDVFKEGSLGIVNLRSTRNDVEDSVKSASNMAHLLEETLDSLRPPAEAMSRKLDDALPIFTSTTSAIVTSCNSIAPEGFIVLSLPRPFVQASGLEDFTTKLSVLDQSLAKTYREAWHSFYAQRYDPLRGALFLMRQVFDHLFELIAPDDKVRESPHWSRKEGDKPIIVYRSERLRFAANRCIKDKIKQLALLESVEEALRSYERLNIAHKRGDLTPEKASEVFKAADSIVRSWVEAADPWPPK